MTARTALFMILFSLLASAPGFLALHIWTKLAPPVCEDRFVHTLRTFQMVGAADQRFGQFVGEAAQHIVALEREVQILRNEVNNIRGGSKPGWKQAKREGE